MTKIIKSIKVKLVKSNLQLKEVVNLTDFENIKLFCGIMSIFITMLFIPISIMACRMLENKPDSPKETCKNFWGRPEKTSYIMTAISTVLIVPGSIIAMAIPLNTIIPVVLITPGSIIAIVFQFHKVHAGIGLILMFVAAAWIATTPIIALASTHRRNKGPKKKVKKIREPILHQNKYQTRYKSGYFY